MSAIYTYGQWIDIVDRGTSGDQVMDILASWKVNAYKLLEDNHKLESRIAELEAENERLGFMAENQSQRYTRLFESTDKLSKLLRDYRARSAELEGEYRWIPVSERLPKENAPVLVLTVLGGMFVDFIHGKSVVTGNPDFYELDVEDVTHWMPLPQPPEVK